MLSADDIRVSGHAYGATGGLVDDIVIIGRHLGATVGRFKGEHGGSPVPEDNIEGPRISD
jgi:hypothetical protein